VEMVGTPGSFFQHLVDFKSAEMTSMNDEIDPRVRELCPRIVKRERNRMLKLITELNNILQQPARQLPPDANMLAAD